jgi:hypothetical protein
MYVYVSTTYVCMYVHAMVHWRKVPFFIYFVLCFFITSSNNAMLHWRRVPFLVHDHTDTESRTMARIAVLCALTYR